MLFPIRCFSCGKVLGDTWERYKEIVFEEEKREQDNGETSYRMLDKYYASLNQKSLSTPQFKALEELNMTRICCRRHFLTHVDI